MGSKRSEKAAGGSRRDFIKQSSLLVAGGAVAGGLSMARAAHSYGSDVIKIGLIGCGGRGTQAAIQAMNTKGDVHLIAMADALAVVDLLAESFTHIAHEDHQEARVRAAEAMATASSETTLQLLQEMTLLPECPVRDAALKALDRRQARTVS